MPDGKIIALLRDPVDRLVSHHHMLQLRASANYNINELVVEQLKKENLLRQRLSEYDFDKEDKNIVVWGEYGRILQPFNELFGPNLLVIFSEELLKYPISIYKKILNFIGTDDYFVPKNVGRKYHDSTKQNKLNSYYLKLRRNPLLRFFWHCLIPEIIRLEYLYKYNLGMKSEGKAMLNSEVENLLVKHYLGDIDHLELIIDRRVPWARFNSDLDLLNS